MTAPRRIIPGTIYLLTRRCSERRFFLRPSKLVNEIVLYILARAAKRYGVLVHAFCFLSNHAHLVVTDVDGRLPAFMQYLDSLVARAVNASLGRFEGFWADDTSFSAVEPIEPRDVVAKIAYTLANPVAAGLVRTGAEWPGLRTATGQLGTATLTATMPGVFFNPRGYMPKRVELELTTPPGFDSAADFQAEVAAEVEVEEEKARQAVRAKGRRFLGVQRVLAQDPFSRPPPGEPRFGMKPRVASRDKWKRIERLAQLVSFAKEYRTALAAWRAGSRDALFPAGTYLMRVLHGAPCAAAA